MNIEIIKSTDCASTTIHIWDLVIDGNIVGVAVISKGHEIKYTQSAYSLTISELESIIKFLQSIDTENLFKDET